MNKYHQHDIKDSGISKTFKFSYCISKYVLFTSIELIQGQKLFCQSEAAAHAAFFFLPSTLKMELNKIVNDEFHVNIIISPSVAYLITFSEINF